MIDRNDPELSIRKQCELLSLNRSLLYYKPAGESSLNLELMRVIDEIHLLDPSLGSPRDARDFSQNGLWSKRESN